MDSSFQHFLCFITTDGNKQAFEIFEDRIASNLWPIYMRTNQFRKVEKDIPVIFYLAGNGVSSQHFIGSAIINEIISPNKKLKVETSNIKFFVNFKNVKKFKKYVPIKNILNQLDFVMNKDKYGLAFQGGITEIDKKSYELIIK